jgi:phage terminase small subunit
MALTIKQNGFAMAYIESGNASEAYRRSFDAGKMAPHSIEVEASRLLQNPEVSLRVEELQAEHRKRHDITVDRILTELSKIGFSNMLDYVKVDGPDAFVDLSTLTRDQAAAIQEVTVEDYKDGRGENARDVRRVKVKLSDKRAALVDLGKHLGMFKELHEHSGKDGGPIKIKRRPMSDIEAARRVAFALGRVLERQEAAKGKG